MTKSASLNCAGKTLVACVFLCDAVICEAAGDTGTHAHTHGNIHQADMLQS